MNKPSDPICDEHDGGGELLGGGKQELREFVNAAAVRDAVAALKAGA